MDHDCSLLRPLWDCPPWEATTVGVPIPDSPHACVVSLPTWASVVGYEEGDDEVIDAMEAGYPRFFVNKLVAQVIGTARKELASDTESVVVFPTLSAAKRAQVFVERMGKQVNQVAAWRDGTGALVLSEDNERLALDYWQHSGEILSSRRAEALMAGVSEIDQFATPLREAIATEMGTDAKEVFLVESGMAAFALAFRGALAVCGEKPTLQLEFPYLDGLKLQEKTGTGVTFLPKAEGEELERVLVQVRAGEFAAVFCETPSNPLLRCVDLPTIAAACREGGVPLIVDDTIASCVNVDALQWADVVTTSLTKWVSGRGDVCGGAVTVNPRSVFASRLRGVFGEETKGGSSLYGGDAEVLVKLIRGFVRRVRKTNDGAAVLAEFLKNHPAVENVWYPGWTTRENYQAIRKPGGGFGGLISFTVKDAARTAEVYDALKLCKGPSLGTEFTLVSPYPMLAHYRELEWAAECGIPAHLLRVSVGVEDPEKLCGIFGEALEVCLA